MSKKMEKHHEYYIDKDGNKVDMGYANYYEQDAFIDHHEKRLNDERDMEHRMKNKAETMALMRNTKATSYSMTKAKEQDLVDDIPIDGNSKAGSLTFMKFCAGCHTLSADSMGQKYNAPALGLIYGRLAGADRGYLNYSLALVHSRKLWTMGSLMTMMKEPDDCIPGLRCGIPRIHLNKQDSNGKRRLDDEIIR